MNFKSLMDVARHLEVNEVVVPDVIGSCDQTISRAREFKRTALAYPEFQYMGVLQGRNQSEVLKCFNGLRFLDYISTIALPRSLANNDQLLRYVLGDVVPKFAAEEGMRFEYHCLGSSNWVREVVLLAELESIRGIDTSMPISFAIAGKRMAQERTYVPRPQGFFEWDPVGWDEAEAIEEVNDNIRTFLEWAAAPGGRV